MYTYSVLHWVDTNQSMGCKYKKRRLCVRDTAIISRQLATLTSKGAANAQHLWSYGALPEIVGKTRDVRCLWGFVGADCSA